MRLRSDWAEAILAACLVAAAAPMAWAGEAGAQLGVSVVVRPAQPAPRALASLPVPAVAQAMTRTPFGGSYRYGGALGEALDYYRDAMPRLGYRLARQQAADAAATLVWEREGERVELDFRQALGATPATRIVVTASAG